MRKQQEDAFHPYLARDEEFDAMCTDLLTVTPPSDLLGKIFHHVSSLPRPDGEESTPVLWKNHLQPS